MILKSQKLRSKTVTLDGPKLVSTTKLLDDLKLQPSTVVFDTSIRRWYKFTDRYRPFGQVKRKEEQKCSKITGHNSQPQFWTVQNYGPQP